MFSYLSLRVIAQSQRKRDAKFELNTYKYVIYGPSCVKVVKVMSSRWRMVHSFSKVEFLVLKGNCSASENMYFLISYK